MQLIPTIVVWSPNALACGFIKPTQVHSFVQFGQIVFPCTQIASFNLRYFFLQTWQYWLLKGCWGPFNLMASILLESPFTCTISETPLPNPDCLLWIVPTSLVHKFLTYMWWVNSSLVADNSFSVCFLDWMGAAGKPATYVQRVKWYNCCIQSFVLLYPVNSLGSPEVLLH